MADIEAGASSALQSGSDSAKQLLNPSVLALLSGMTGNRLAGMGTSMQPQPTTPQPPVQYKAPDILQEKTHFATVGERKRADKAQMYQQIAGLTKSATDFIQQKKIRAMQMDTERLLSAYQGMQEAKASGDQEALKKNTEIVNVLMSDPKKVKQFEKAFNVSLMDDKGKDSAEHQGMMKAMREWQLGGKQGLSPVAQKFQDTQPVRQGINPQAAAMEQMVKAGIIPSADALQKSQTELIKLIQQTENVDTKVQATKDIAKMYVDAKDRVSQKMIEKTILENQGKLGVAEMQKHARMYAADKQLQGVMNNPRWQIMRDQLKAKQNDPTMKNLFGTYGMIDKKMKTLDDQLKVATKAGDDKQVRTIQSQIQATQLMQKLLINKAEDQIGIDNSDSQTELDDSQMQQLQQLLDSSDE